MLSFTPEYWPPISHVAALYNADQIVLQSGGTYQKQSFLNRCKVAGVHGVLTLSVPLLGGREQKMPFQEVLIDNSQRWAIQHLRTLQSFYGKAPYFEYYFPAIKKLLLQHYERLEILNEQLLQRVMTWLKWEGRMTATTEFKIPEMPDVCLLPPYVQVFNDRLPFYPDLSILDLFFCLGPVSADYLGQLRQQTGC